MTDIPKKPDNYKGWFETESAANTDYQPEYRYNHTMETPRGHSIELDDTPGRERIRISHRAKTFIEIDPEGKLTYKAFGNMVEISLKNKNVKIGGDYTLEIEGDYLVNVKGNKIETIEGNHELHVKGHYNQICEKTTTLGSQNDMNIAGGANATGTVRIQAGDAFVINSDLVVKGALTARNVSSLGRVDAVKGIGAGAPGFNSLDGGLNIGPGVPVPGLINCSGIINAVGSVISETAVIGEAGLFGVMVAGTMTDGVNTKIYNTHTHVGAEGVITSPPAPPMV